MVHPEYHTILQRVHTSFLQAGAIAITTNSYGVTPGVGFQPIDITKYVALAGQIARQSVDEFVVLRGDRTNDDDNDNVDDKPIPYVFGSLGPLVESYRPDLIMKHDEGVPIYKKICHSLSPYVDAYLAETMSCVNESKQAVEAISQQPLSEDANKDEEEDGNLNEKKDEGSFARQQRRLYRPLLISYTLNSKGCFRDGQDVRDGINEILDFITKPEYKHVRCKLTAKKQKFPARFLFVPLVHTAHALALVGSKEKLSTLSQICERFIWTFVFYAHAFIIISSCNSTNATHFCQSAGNPLQLFRARSDYLSVPTSP